MRRSGATSLARRGLSLARVQWYSRWGSATVLCYVEEAAEESAELRGLESSWDDLRVDLASALRTQATKGLGESRAQVHELLSESSTRTTLAEAGVQGTRLVALEEFAAEARKDLGQTRALVTELDRLIRPELVLNTSSGVLHRAVRPNLADPLATTTKCGWRWAKSPLGRPALDEEVGLAGLGWTKCKTCHQKTDGPDES